MLTLGFSGQEQARYAELTQKAQEGKLSESEEADLDEFLAANALLSILQSKVRISLKKHHPAA